MKTFIFLIILIVAFFSYIFMFSPKTQKAIPQQQKPKIEIANLESFEQSVYEKARKKPKLTSQNLEEIADLSSNAPQPISEQMTFDLLKKIIHLINRHYPDQLITLNTPMRTLIRTPKERALFQQKVTATFNITQKDAQKYMQKNKLLWDWVNVLQ